MIRLMALPLATVLLAAPTLAQDNPTDPQQFVNMATSSNMFEIESSKLALEKAETAPAKEFAQHMITDHTKAGEDMKAAAAAAGVTVPTELDEAHRAKMERLSSLDGTTFDKTYVAEQVTAHEEAVALFDEYSSDGADGPLKEFAAKTLPTLEAHLEAIEKLADE